MFLFVFTGKAPLLGVRVKELSLLNKIRELPCYFNKSISSGFYKEYFRKFSFKKNINKFKDNILVQKNFFNYLSNRRNDLQKTSRKNLSKNKRN